MTPLLWTLALLVPGGCLLAVAVYFRKRQQVRAWIDAPNYVQAIAALEPERPISLPAIKPLKAKKVWRLREVKRA